MAIIIRKIFATTKTCVQKIKKEKHICMLEKKCNKNNIKPKSSLQIINRILCGYH